MLLQLFNKIDFLVSCYVNLMSKNCDLNIIEYCVNLNHFISLSLFVQDIKLESGKLKLNKQHENDLMEEKKNLKEKASIVAQCLERKEETVQNHAKKHRSLIFVEDTGANITDFHQKHFKEAKAVKKKKSKTNKSNLEPDNKLPSDVIQELTTVLQKNKVLPEETYI